MTLVFTTPDNAFIQDISIAVIRGAYARLGYQIEVKKLPNIRALETANRGEVDGEVSRVAGINDRFPKLVSIPVSINKLEIVAFSDDSQIQITSWDDISQYRSICIRGVKLVEQELRNRELSCEFVSTIQQAIDMLHVDRADLLLIPRLNGMHVIRSLNERKVMPVSKVLTFQDLYHYVHVKNIALVDDLTQVLEVMANSGEIDRIRQDVIAKDNINHDKQ